VNKTSSLTWVCHRCLCPFLSLPVCKLSLPTDSQRHRLNRLFPLSQPITAMNPLYHNPHLPPRRTHRKRHSASRLSSETVQTLPEYSSPPRWPNAVSSVLLEGEESDRPPDYPTATDEGDADTEDDQEISYFPQHLVASSKRRSPSYIRRRKHAMAPPPPPVDPFLDTLLERSVHALELSNALLQSSISTQTSLSTLLSPVENEPDRTLEVRARNLSTRIRVNSGMHTTWMDHLDDISKGVDKLLEDDSPSADESAVSRSLPTFAAPELRHRRKPSLLELSGSSSSNSQLQYSHPARDRLIAPPPRALTQFVESSTDPELIILPSTLGLRSTPSTHPRDLRTHFSEHFLQITPSQSSGSISEPNRDNGPSAYNLLSNLVKRSNSSDASSRFFGSPTRRGSESTESTERGSAMSSPSSGRTIRCDRMRSRTQVSPPQSRPETPRQLPTPLQPPLETLPASSSESLSSVESSSCFRTMQSLRRILDNQPSSLSVNDISRKEQVLRRAPSFFPVTPPPAPLSATSAATASISRLLTKGRHSLSTRPPSPPAHSSLKIRSVPPTPASSPSTLSLVDLFGNGVAKAIGSATPSPAGTPKRISFAELPESYSRSRPGPSKLREKKAKKKAKCIKNKTSQESTGWFKTWFGGGLIAGPSTGRWQEERFEDRMTRGWARPGYGAVDEWAM